VEPYDISSYFLMPMPILIFLAGATEFSPIQTDFVVQPPSYLMLTKDYFPEGQEAGV
jgi:hypothetical protein